ncbi:acyl-CoA dehydrogenase family protein [Candidatus Palauibacter sp.]|uniref:acyl-CoA dehydrogenase family protein n=1 Tax=Candidatus Palauibacter sp. TaxID=3101350 RepID=UPI003B016B3B
MNAESNAPALFSERSLELHERVREFMDAWIYPNEGTFEHQLETAADRFSTPPILEELKGRAKDEGLWNLFLPPDAEPGGGSDDPGGGGENLGGGPGDTPDDNSGGGPDEPPTRYGAGLSNLEYALICETMGRVEWAPEVFNCNAPDTGNMETLARYGTEAQRTAWLEPLLAGEIRSSFAMTEPDVASSDATNIRSSIVRDGDEWVIEGHKWWATQAPRAECRIFIFMGKTDPEAPRHLQQAMVLVPRDAPGVEVVRHLDVFGYDSAPLGHGEVRFRGVRVPADHILLGPGRGFEIAQGRLGPGRIHHCMRLVGVAERALEAMAERAKTRVAFSGPLAEKGALRHALAEGRIAVEQARLLTLHAAHMMDTVGNKAARREIAMIKVVAPRMACRVLDQAIQVHGALGVSPDTWLAAAYAHSRTLRLADGPDEVHLEAIARHELRG